VPGTARPSRTSASRRRAAPCTVRPVALGQAVLGCAKSLMAKIILENAGAQEAENTESASG
jgi:hypothetical protein